MINIDKYLDYSDKNINDVKEAFKYVLSKNNEWLDETQLDEIYSFIDNGIIDFSNSGFFLKNEENGKYDFISDVSVYQNAKKEIFSSKTKSKIKNQPGIYTIINYGVKKYILNLNRLFEYATKKKKSFYARHFSASLDDLIDIASDNGVYCLDNVFEMKDKKRIRKVVIGDRNIQIYKIDFGKYGVYIGQSKNVEKRMSGHKNHAKKKEHCFILNQLYENDKDYFCKCLENYQILEKPKIVNYEDCIRSTTDIEYSYQIEALRNGERLLGKQCWDKDFRQYLATHVDEYEYQELLEKSFEINNDPNLHDGYSTYNPYAKQLRYKTMDYKDVVKYFESLRNQKENTQ